MMNIIMRLYVSRLRQTSFCRTQLDLVGLALNISFDFLEFINTRSLRQARIKI